MERKKVLFMAQLPPPVHGVSTINQLIIQSDYIRRNIDFDILPINTSRSLEEIDRLSFIKIILSLKIVTNLFRRLFKKRYHLVYFTANLRGLAFYRDIIYLTILKLFNQKIIYHLHGYGVTENSKNFLMKYLYKWYFHKSKVITLAETIYRDISDFVKLNDRFILHNAIPLSVQDDALDSLLERRITNHSVNILFLSNMMESKGPLILLKALKVLKGEGYKFGASFVGGWISESYKVFFSKSIIEYGLQDCTELRGFCSSEEKSEIFAKSDIFVFPTLRDTWALVILEAMEYALPIISTKEGAIPEIINDGVEGFIVPKNDVVSLVEKMKILINNEDLRIKIGRAARKSFLENYSFAQYERALINIFNQIK